MTYACSENFILVLSHDEVVHLKCSMLNKMPGYLSDKFANLKVGYTFMMGHPGKKLLFMGQEFGQLREWSEERELDWFLLKEPEHQKLQSFYRDLLHLYKKISCLLLPRTITGDGLNGSTATTRTEAFSALCGKITANGTIFFSSAILRL